MDALAEASAGRTDDLYYLDTAMYDSPEYGAVYVLDADRPALVDTGTGAKYERVLSALQTLDIEPESLAAIVLTHVHLDHAGGASVLARECPNADVYVHESGAQFLTDPTAIWEGTKAVMGDRISYYREPDPIPSERIETVTDEDRIDLGNHELTVRHAPGHAFHQVVYYDHASDGVFTADAAGINIPGLAGVRQTSPPSDFHLEEALADVEMLQSLDPQALYYPHFGDRPADDLLAEYATVLRDWVESIEAKREELGDDEAVIDYFVERTETGRVWTDAHATGEERMNVQGVLQYLDQRGDE